MSASRETTGPTLGIIKRLFARSGNRCAFPRCQVAIVQEKTVVGHVCHINAARAGGPRYDAGQTPDKRHGFDNLILLCPTHHVVIDDDEEAYTVARLVKMKSEHEQRATAIGDEQAAAAAQLLLEKSVTSINQSGGVTAHTVHQVINIHPMHAEGDQREARRSTMARARSFHDDRVGKIADGKAPIALLDGGIMVLHVAPFATLDGGHASSFEHACRDPDRFPPMRSNRPSDWDIRYNGSDSYLLTGSNGEGLSKPQRAYVCVFGFGAVEAVASSVAIGHEDRFLELPLIQAMVIKHARVYAKSLSAIGSELPFAVLMSLVDVAGKRLLQDFNGNAVHEDQPFGLLSGARIQFGEAVFDTLPADDNEAAKLLDPILRRLANAAGLGTSPYFDAAGNYTLKFPL